MSLHVYSCSEPITEPDIIVVRSTKHAPSVI